MPRKGGSLQLRGSGVGVAKVPCSLREVDAIDEWRCVVLEAGESTQTSGRGETGSRRRRAFAARPVQTARTERLEGSAWT